MINKLTLKKGDTSERFSFNSAYTGATNNYRRTRKDTVIFVFSDLIRNNIDCGKHKTRTAKMFSSTCFEDTQAPLSTKPANNNTYDIRCPICCDEYTDPIIISCHHSFCKKCLDTWMRNNLVGRKVNPHPTVYYRRVFPCPYCKAEIEVPPNGINGFSKSFHVEQLKEMNAKLTAKSQYPKCQKHMAEDLKFFCNKCYAIICRDCKILDHEGHKAEMIDVVAAEKRMSLKIEVWQAEKDLDKLKSIEANCNKEQKIVSDNKDLAINTLREQVDAIKQRVDARAMKLEKDITTKFRVYESNIDKELSEVNQTRKKLSNFIETTSSEINASSDHGVVANYDNLLNSSKSISVVENRWPIADYQSTLSKIYCPGDMRLQELESMVGSVSSLSYPAEKTKIPLPKKQNEVKK